MVPAHPRVLLKVATPRRFGDPEYAADIAAEIYGGTVRTDPEPVADLFYQQMAGGSLARIRASTRGRSGVDEPAGALGDPTADAHRRWHR